MEDVPALVKEITNPSRRWRVNLVDDDAHAHLGATLLGAEKMFPLRHGEIVKETWQNILLAELDGPRGERRVVVEMWGNKPSSNIIPRHRGAESHGSDL